MSSTTNLTGSWKRRRFTMRGFGIARFGTTPWGGRPQAYHVTRNPYPESTAPAQAASASWTEAAAPSGTSGSWSESS